MRHCNRSLIVLMLLLAGCHVVREIENVRCNLPYQLRDAQLSYYRDHLSFRVSDPVRGLNNARIVPDTLLLKDGSGKRFTVNVSEVSAASERSSHSAPETEKMTRREFAFKLPIPESESYALPEGNYSLSFSLANQGSVFPLECRFSVVDRTKDFSPGTFH